MGQDALEEFLLDRGVEPVWELFHENSKLSPHDPHLYFGRHPSDATVVSVMRQLRTVKSYDDMPKCPLPRELPESAVLLDEAVAGRETARAFGDGAVRLDELAKVLFCACGVTRDNIDTDYPRPFRTTPSGGALYPLEAYVAVRRVTDLAPGLYHYDPEAHELDRLRSGAVADDVAAALVQRDLAQDAALVILLSAVFFRSTFKYGDRGYRFALLEAGHVAQNVLLSAGAIGLAAAPVGGYMDRDVDRLLGVDGVDESVVYVLLCGTPT